MTFFILLSYTYSKNGQSYSRKGNHSLSLWKRRLWTPTIHQDCAWFLFSSDNCISTCYQSQTFYFLEKTQQTLHRSNSSFSIYNHAHSYYFSNTIFQPHHLDKIRCDLYYRGWMLLRLLHFLLCGSIWKCPLLFCCPFSILLHKSSRKIIQIWCITRGRWILCSNEKNNYILLDSSLQFK